MLRNTVTAVLLSLLTVACAPAPDAPPAPTEAPAADPPAPQPQYSSIEDYLARAPTVAPDPPPAAPASSVPWDRCEVDYQAVNDLLQTAAADVYAVATGRAAEGCSAEKNGARVKVTCAGAPWVAEGEIRGASFVGTIGLTNGCRYDVSATPATGYLAWSVAQ